MIATPLDAEAIERLLEKGRQKAIDLDIDPVGGLTLHAGDGEFVSCTSGSDQ